MSSELQDLSGTTYERTKLHDARFSWVDLSGSWFRQSSLSGVRMRGVELVDVEIDGELQNVVINGVDDEWSFIETLRHLCYATDAWVNRVYLGDPDPWSSLDLPFTSMRDWYWAYDTDIRPSLDEVLALRADRQAKVRRVLAELTDERLGEETVPVEGKGWPPADRYPVAEVLGVVVNEEWHHRRYAERDLAVLERHD
jgi:hypothetical protein